MSRVIILRNPDGLSAFSSLKRLYIKHPNLYKYRESITTDLSRRKTFSVQGLSVIFRLDIK